MWQWLLVPIAYLFGSLSSAIITSRLMGLPDPRTEGSKNPGATNVLRLGGKKAAAITLLGDILKGVIPLLIAKALGSSDAVLGAVGLSAFVGHLYPVFFGFKGGKGAATAGGVYYGYAWGIGLIVMLTWVAVAFLTRISSLSALIASALAPVYIWFFLGSPELTVASIMMGIVLFWRHKENIQRLLRGEESKIGR
jgi:glycerol-3-phosphate acyltransferase PlsY